MTTNPYEASLVPEPLVAPAFPTRGSPTEVEFDLTVEDYVVFNQEHTDRMFAECATLQTQPKLTSTASRPQG